MKKLFFFIKLLLVGFFIFFLAIARNGNFWRFTIGGLLALSAPQVSKIVTPNTTITSPNSQTTVIHQTGQKAIINWKSFNIGPNESTHFQQPVGGIALNRINPQQGASQIYGVLTSTGQIILMNPAGIFFGPSAYVNVGGLIATTGSISNEDFLKGNYYFTKLSAYPNAFIINEGTIIAAQYGLIALVAPQVINKGLIEAQMGHIILASGNAFTINFDPNSLISFNVDEKVFGKIVNKGVLRANGGRILITAKTAQSVLDSVINMEGIAEAKSVTKQNGELVFGGIEILGDQDVGVVRIASQLDVSGKDVGQEGGQVKVTGYQVLIDTPALIDVSGDIGGGNIYIGGNFQGKGPLPNAQAVILAPNATLIADAITLGEGGDIILWSNDVTKAYGNISVRGGKLSGSGGFIEVSGKNYLSFLAKVNAGAPFGKPGKLLLDPTTIFIIEGPAGSGDLDRSFDHAILAFDVHDMPRNTVSVGQLQSFRDIDIILQAQKALTVGSEAGEATRIDLPELIRSTLTLQAGDAATIGGGDIIFNTGSSIRTGGGGVILIAGDEKQKTGNATLGAILTSGGDLKVTAQEGVTLNDRIDVDRGSVSITALNKSLTIGSNITAADNSISLSGANITQNADTMVNAGSGKITYNAGSGTITTYVNTQIYSTGMITLIGNNMVLDTRSIFSQIGGIDSGTYAANVILTQGTPNTTIGIAGGIGTLALSQAELNTIHATNARIGSSTSGLMTIGTWTPGPTFVPGSGVLTLNSGHGITQTGPITLNANDNLFIRGAGTFALTNPNNVLSNIAANLTSGSLSITNIPSIRVTSMADDLGAISGIVAPGGVTLTVSGTSSSLIVDKSILATNNPINLSGRNITFADYVIIGSGSSDITLNASTGILGTGIITLNTGTRLLSGNASGTTGTINLTADNMTFSGSAQLGGTATDTGYAKTIILQPYLAGRSIGLAGGTGNLSLTVTELSRLRATNVRIGSPTAGPITTGTAGLPWTPASTFATNLLTLSSASAISQTPTSSINLGTARGLLLRDATMISLNEPNNVFTKIAAATPGTLSLISAGTLPLTVTTLTDDLGTVSGVTATGGVFLKATNADAGIILNAPITANTLGDSIVLVSPTFINNVGASALAPGLGRFLVWSGNPANDNRGGIVYNFKQYNATYNLSPVLGSGSGFLYTTAPVIIPGLTGTITKVYDTTTVATLADSNYTPLGTIDNDLVILNNPATGSYATKNVGTNINVSVSGIAIVSATDGSAIVYGYQLGSTTANANIGIITPAHLTANLKGTVSKIYDALTTATLAANNYLLTGVLGSDIVNLNNPSTGHYENANVGVGKKVTVSGLALTGADAGNYQLASTTIFGNIGTITPATLTVSGIHVVNKIYNRSASATLNLNSASLRGVLNSDVVGLNAHDYRAVFAASGPGVNIPVTVTRLSLVGPAAQNYQLVQPTGLTGNIALVTVPPGVIFPTNYIPPGVNVPVKPVVAVIENKVGADVGVAVSDIGGVGKKIVLPEVKAIPEQVAIQKPAVILEKEVSAKVKPLEVEPVIYSEEFEPENEYALIVRSLAALIIVSLLFFIMLMYAANESYSDSRIKNRLLSNHH